RLARRPGTLATWSRSASALLAAHRWSTWSSAMRRRPTVPTCRGWRRGSPPTGIGTPPRAADVQPGCSDALHVPIDPTDLLCHAEGSEESRVDMSFRAQRGIPLDLSFRAQRGILVDMSFRAQRGIFVRALRSLAGSG